MIKISEENVLDIKSLANANPAAFNKVVKWLDANFEELDEAINHLDPNPEDFNFNTRFHHRRGFVACLDTLRHFLASPDDAIPKEEKVEPEKDNAF
jgi:hypothetical protein